MPRKKTEICIECQMNLAQDGRYCHSCRNKNRKNYFQTRYKANGGYEWHKTQTKEFKLRKALSMRASGKCERCGWDKAEEILQIHHKDRNKNNNAINNLEFLCPTCHLYHHFLEGTGLYHSDKSKYLPT